MAIQLGYPTTLSVIPGARILIGIGTFLLLGIGTAVQAAEPSDYEVRAASQIRALFGLPDDLDEVRNLLTGGDDVGTLDWGVAMTKSEADEIDIGDRVRFLDSLEEDILPYVRKLPEFGGVWQDQRHNGRLVVMVTSDAENIREQIDERMPGSSRGVIVRTVDHDYAELDRAFRRAMERWNEVAPAIPATAVGIDVAANGLVLKVGPKDLGDARRKADDLAERLGVPVEVRAEDAGQDLACDDRAHCTPMRGGVQIRKGSTSSSAPRCTLGFFVTVSASSTPTQALTAGHCGYTSPSTWYHPGLSGDHKIGTERGTLYAYWGIDAMRVAVDDGDSVMSRIIYGYTSPTNVYSPVYPVQGETLCMSMGNSNTKACGAVDLGQTSWISETPSPDYMVVGAALDTFSTYEPAPCALADDGTATPCPGDSGSPLYRRAVFDDPDWNMRPMGILDHEYYPSPPRYGGHDVYFAIVRDVIDEMGIVMWAP